MKKCYQNEKRHMKSKLKFFIIRLNEHKSSLSDSYKWFSTLPVNFWTYLVITGNKFHRLVLSQGPHEE